jgi:hypothetical protein
MCLLFLLLLDGLLEALVAHLLFFQAITILISSRGCGHIRPLFKLVPLIHQIHQWTYIFMYIFLTLGLSLTL